MAETWKKIRGFSHYEVSNRGRVRSSHSKHRDKKDGHYYMSAIPHELGYKRAQLLCPNGRTVTKYVHRLVAEAFVKKPDGLKRYEVNHKDRDKSNNHAGNLEWVTRKGNIRHAVQYGAQLGGKQKLSQQQKDSLLRLCRDGAKRKQIAKKYGISLGHVYALLRKSKQCNARDNI